MSQEHYAESDYFQMPMELTLTYRGPLPSSQGNSKISRTNRNNVKALMREEFHEQLRAHCASVAPINRFYRNGEFLLEEKTDKRISTQTWFTVRHTPTNTPFVPVVMSGLYLKLVCELDIKLLTRDQPGSIMNHGDLDNRTKTLLDALRLPLPNEDCIYTPPAGALCFCLLEDDKLITRIQIKTGRLLRAAKNGERDSDVELDIFATITQSDTSEWPLQA